jgi:hypothetical protein
MVGKLIGLRAFAPVNAPTQAHPDLTWGFWQGWIDPAGAIVYAVGAPGFQGVRRFVTDALRWDGFWTGPLAPLANDPVLATTTEACPQLVVTHFVMQAETGALLLDCGWGYPPSHWYDQAGRLRVTPHDVLSWTADDYILAVTNGQPGIEDSVFDPAGNATGVKGLPASSGIHIARVHPAGFRALVLADSGAGVVYQSWIIARDGTATLEGTYADPPPDTAPGGLPMYQALDAGGVLYEADWVNHLVLRRPLQPGTSTIAHDGRYHPGYNDVDSPNLNPYLIEADAFITAP